MQNTTNAAATLAEEASDPGCETSGGGGLCNRVVGEARPGQAVGDMNVLLKSLHLERVQRTSQLVLHLL